MRALQSRLNESITAELLIRHALLLAADAVERERLSLPEVVALLQSAELVDADGEPWTERSLANAVKQRCLET